MLASCGTAPKAVVPADRAPSVPTVATSKVTRTDMVRRIVVTGEFKPFQEVDVMARVAGYVKKLHVDAGDKVLQSQLLAVLEIPEMADDLARARASIDKSQAEVSHAQDGLHLAESAHEAVHLSYTRLRDVAKEKPALVALEEVDVARGRDLVAEAQVNSAKSVLLTSEKQVQVNRAELQRMQTMLDYTKVTAPFAGVITRRYSDTGTMVQSGTMPIVRLSDNRTLRLVLPVPESAVPKLHLGDAVRARVPTLNSTVVGRVARFNDKVSLATRTMDAEVDVPNADFHLIPGMYAEVDLTLESRPRALAVPAQAIDLAGSENTGQVLVVTPQGHIEMREVQLGLQTATEVEILSGVAEGEHVVVGSRSGLKPGQVVQAKPTQLGGRK